jgi:hypothetical protein
MPMHKITSSTLIGQKQNSISTKAIETTSIVDSGMEIGHQEKGKGKGKGRAKESIPEDESIDEGIEAAINATRGQVLDSLKDANQQFMLAQLDSLYGARKLAPEDYLKVLSNMLTAALSTIPNVVTASQTVSLQPSVGTGNPTTLTQTAPLLPFLPTQAASPIQTIGHEITMASPETEHRVEAPPTQEPLVPGQQTRKRAFTATSPSPSRRQVAKKQRQRKEVAPESFDEATQAFLANLQKKTMSDEHKGGSRRSK